MTAVSEAGTFWEAEPEHQDYLQKYPDGYTCHFAPQLEAASPRTGRVVPTQRGQTPFIKGV